MFLLDTNIISALAPSKRETSGDLADWLDAASGQLFLSVITATEVTAGIAKARREGATTKARLLEDWWRSIDLLYSSKLLDFDLRCAYAAGEILDHARAYQPGFEDIAIAATAKVHGLTVLTRNLRHFGPLGVAAIDPTRELPTLPSG